MDKSRHPSRSMGRWLMALLLVMLSSLAMRAAEAYACYTSSNTTLTFYYDSQRSSRPGIKFDMNEGSEQPRWITSGYNANVTSVVISPSFANARPTSTYYWFYHMNQITTVNGLNYLNTEAVTNMSYMFYECSNLTSLDVSGFNTSNVTDMGQMFCECSRLTALDVSHFNTANVVNMTQMFCFCSSLTALDVSDFNTANVTTMYGLFQGCLKLTALDVSNFTTPKAMRLSFMFQGCSKLTALDVSNFNTANVTEMNSMFNGCSNLTTIYASSLWRTDAVTSSTNMFKGCTSLVGGMGTTYDADHVDAAYAHIDGGTSNPGYFTELVLEPYACYTPENTTLTFYYDTQRSSRTGTTYDLNTGSFIPGWNNVHTNVTKVVFDPSFANARPTSTYGWFYAMQKLQFITGMSYLNTSEVTNMSSMFFYCSALTSLDLSSFNTANVTDMSRMFYYCKKLTSLNVSSFNTAKVTDMCDMFSNCSSLSSLDLSSFNTANVTDMSDMFRGGSSLSSLDLSSFNTAKVTNMTNMFYNCTNLRTIYVGSGWSTAAVEYSLSMFRDCSSLVGGQGTTYDESHVNAAYAHIDGGPTNPGYFTRDPNSPEAYACYTPSNTTLTFYYDTERSSRTGTTYDLPTGDAYPRWYEEGTNYNVTRVVFDPSFADAHPTSTRYWFNSMQVLQSIIGMKEYLNTSEVTDMGGMFGSCWALTSLDVSSFNTSNVTDMGNMFNGCSNLTSLDLSNFNTSNVTYMYSMFERCSSLTSLDVRSFNTANVTYMSYMFSHCEGLTNLDLSSFNTAKVAHIHYMFSYCGDLATIYVGDGWSTAAVINSSDMFTGCTSLVGGMGTAYDVYHTNLAYAHIDGGPSNPGYFTEKGPEAYACYTPSNTTLTFYYDKLRSSRTGTTYDLDTENNYPGWYSDGTNADVTKVTFDPSFADARPTTTYFWFSGMSNLTSITGLNLLNTSEVTMMFNMFRDCSSLTSLDVSSFNTAKVTNMGCMFQGCSALTSLDVSSFNTANVTVMQSMFYGCSGLTSLDLSNFNTAKVIMMDRMFYGCSAMTNVDLSSFNTSNVTEMQSMFSNCSALTSLDLSSFNTAKVTYMEYMFSGCSNLRTIYVSDSWSTAAVRSSTNMFQYCTSLVGGMGTTWKFANPTNKTYAHVDGGSSNPGYFTYKPAFIRGDVNNDGKVSIIDVTFLINYLLTQDATGINLQGADTTLNNIININDVSFLINYLLTGSW